MDAQQQAEQALTELSRIVDRWSSQMGLETQGMGTLVAATSERMSRIESYESRVFGLLEKTDAFAAEKQPVTELAETQATLAAELGGFRKELERRNRDEPDPDLPPLLSRLDQAEGALTAAVAALKADDADTAIHHQEQAADALAEADTLVIAQNLRLGMLQDLLMFQRAVGFANGYMADLVAQQRDLLEATRANEPKDMTGRLPQFANVRACLDEVAPLLDLVAARLDVGTPLVFAKADFDDAIASLESGDKLDAIDAQDVAAESLADVQARVQAVQSQTGYVAEIVAYLHASVADVAALRHEQQTLSDAAAAAPPEKLAELSAKQDALRKRAEALGRELAQATGIDRFSKAGEQMQDVLAALSANDASAAAGQMRLVDTAFAQDAESLLAVITVLHGLPAIEVTAQSEPALVRLVDVLAVASDHKTLLRRTHDADAQAMPTIADQQADLAERCKPLANTGTPHPLLTAASAQLTAAADRFGSADRAALRTSQRAADQALRQFIIDQAIVLDT